MRTNEERIQAMHTRATELDRQRRVRQVRIMQSAGAVVSFAAVIMIALFMPKLPAVGTGSPEDPAVPTGGMSASIFGDSAALGYIVIALIAFLLGVALTIFCFRLRQWQEHKDKEEY